MSQKKAKTERRAARTAHLTDDQNTPWTPLMPGVITNKENSMYDPALDGDVFVNDRYVVFRRVIQEGFVHLSIRRKDRRAIHDWRDFQRIKTELAGAEWEGVEVYPKESRLVDTSNQYHLWCMEAQVPFGFDSGRCVTDDFGIAGAKQRRLPPDWEKTDHTEVVKQAQMVAADRSEGKKLGVDFREEVAR